MINENVERGEEDIIPEIPEFLGSRAGKRKYVKRSAEERAGLSRKAKLYNHRVRQLNESIERKLPNEFRGALRNYNVYAVGGFGHIDENNY